MRKTIAEYVTTAGLVGMKYDWTMHVMFAPNNYGDVKTFTDPDTLELFSDVNDFVNISLVNWLRERRDMVQHGRIGASDAPGKLSD